MPKFRSSVELFTNLRPLHSHNTLVLDVVSFVEWSYTVCVCVCVVFVGGFVLVWCFCECVHVCVCGVCGRTCVGVVFV